MEHSFCERLLLWVGVAFGPGARPLPTSWRHGQMGELAAFVLSHPLLFLLCLVAEAGAEGH